MTTAKRVCCFVALASLLGGCASPDRVMFVTDTELGVGYDAAVGNVYIGSDRNELVIGPAYPDTGALPPVYARMQSNASIFDPKVKQLYATGKASEIATGTASNGQTPVSKAPQLSGPRRLMVFGTSTNVGLKVNFASALATAVPTAVNFGYKRQEFSLIPLREEGKRATGEDKYASTLAAISIGSGAAALQNTHLDVGQFFATGVAAENLAADPVIQKLFNDEAATAVAAASIPLTKVAEARLANEICAYEGQRAGDSVLHAKLNAVEVGGPTLKSYCADPSGWAKNGPAICTKLKSKGLACNG
ncbi:MAG: hypothetical protein ACI9DC_001812 [Gammaproteobacteria bacterium]|jgi:hypothetical protein